MGWEIRGFNAAGIFKDRIKADVNDSIAALRATREQVSLIEKELNYAKEVEEGERIKFKAGDSTILLVNIRELATADTSIKYLKSLADYQIAKAMLKMALGGVEHSN